MFSMLLRKDLHAVISCRGLFVSLLGFSLLAVFVSYLAFVADSLPGANAIALVSGVRWLVFLFCAVSLLNQSFISELRGGALAGLLETQCDPGKVYLSKTLVNVHFLLLLDLVVVLLLSGFFAPSLTVPVFALWLLGIPIVLGFSALGTLLSAISVRLDGRELLLPLLLFPLCAPLLLAAVTRKCLSRV